MPKEYEAMRDALVAKGKDYDTAQAIAAATYNKRHPKRPMTHNKDALLREMDKK